LEKDEIIGQRVIIALKRGDVILWSNFVETKTGENLSDIIKVGERAFTMSVDIISSIANFLRPNDHIDIIGTFNDPQKGTTATLTILQNVTILAVNQVRQTQTGMISSADEESLAGINTVVILVTPKKLKCLFLLKVWVVSLSS